MKKYRIREENKKFYPERYIKTLFGGYWTSEWHTMFILGEWCGALYVFEFDIIDDCKNFLSDRQLKYVFLTNKSIKMYQEPTSPMNFRIVEKQFENKSEFHPEWFCDNVNACNHGWNSVHDSRLMTIPTNTYEDSLKRIKWFSNCFQKPLLEVIHEVV